VTLGPAAYWRLQITGWALFGAINAAVALGVAHMPVIAAMGQALGLGAVGFGLSHLLYLWIQRQELIRRSVQIRILHVVSFSLGLSIPAGVLTSLTKLAVWQTSDLPMDAGMRWLLVPLIHSLNWVLWLLLWGALYFSLRSFRERALGELRDSRLQPFVKEAGTKVEIHDGVVDARLQALAEGRTLLVERAVELGENVIKRGADRALATGQALVDLAGAGDQDFVQLAGTVVQRGVQLLGVAVHRGRTRLELPKDKLSMLAQARRQGIQPRVEFVGECESGGGERLQQ